MWRKPVKQFGHAVNTTCALIAAMPVHIVLGTSKKHTSGKQKAYNIIWTMLGIGTIMENRIPNPSNPDARVKNTAESQCSRLPQNITIPSHVW